jgi:hypothetical protein
LLEQLSVDHFLSNLAVEPQELLFHYTERCTLQKILTSGNIRLNTLDKMNDPRADVGCLHGYVARCLELHSQLDHSILIASRTICSEIDSAAELGDEPVP